MIDTTPLRPAVKGDRQVLPRAVLSEIQERNGARPVSFTLQLVAAWAVIVGVVVWAAHADAVWASAIAVVVVSTRQNVLGLLVHEQAHLLGYKGKYGDLLVNFFAAYPLLVLTVEDYAQVHLAHHRDYFSDKDPDFLRKSGEEWSVPKSRGELFRLFATDVLGINTVKLIRGKRRGWPGVCVRAAISHPPLGTPDVFPGCRGRIDLDRGLGNVSSLLGVAHPDDHPAIRAMGCHLRAQVQPAGRLGRRIHAADYSVVVGAPAAAQPQLRDASLSPLFSRDCVRESYRRSMRSTCAKAIRRRRCGVPRLWRLSQVHYPKPKRAIDRVGEARVATSSDARSRVAS